MLNFSSYSGRDLQNIRSILIEMDRKEITPKKVLNMLDLFVSEIKKAHEFHNSSKLYSCPECGTPMILIELPEIKVFECKKCRYSEVIK